MVLTHQQALSKLEEDIKLRGLSSGTVEVYVANVNRFLKFSNVTIDVLNEEHTRRFIVELAFSRSYAPRTVNLYSASIRFIFAVTLNRTLNYLQIPLMKRPKLLPTVLSKAEVKLLVENCSNLKQKAVILLAYGSGLRVSEIARLKTSDIDSHGMRLFIRDSKGGKDRFTLLSLNTLETLRSYWRDFHPASSDGYLFPSPRNIGHITRNAVQLALNQVVRKVALDKHVTRHTFRHSFATHLLEDGYSLLQIKELLGHSSISTTTLYLHLANTTRDIRSPADTLFLPPVVGNHHD